MRHLLSAAFAVSLMAVPVLAHHDEEASSGGGIMVSHLWTAETSAVSDSVDVFLTIANTGSEPDRLVEATTSFSASGRFQAPMLVDGAVRVVDAPSIEIAPGQTLSFQRGGITLVLGDVKRELSAGGHFHMTLVFEKAGRLTVDVEIEDADHDPSDKPAT